jgi:hypothetical protein
MAAAGALMANVLVSAQPAAQADAAPVSVAQQLALTARSTPAQETVGFRRLEQSAAGRGDREAAQLAAQQAQAAADQAVLDRQRAEAEAAAAARAAAEAEAARVAAEAAARAAAEAAQAAQASSGQQAEESRGTAAAAGQATGSARITNNSGSVESQVQAAADVVTSNVPGAAGITLGGTRASAADPGGHPSGLALDYMVMSDDALGDAIAQYHIDHWDSLGVDYLIWQQRYLSSPTGSWKQMEDRGGVTANHHDHVHVNYRG